MNTPVRDFCKKYKEKSVNDAHIKKLLGSGADPLEAIYDRSESINFYVISMTTIPFSMSNGREVFFQLDEEDLKYLYDKYYKQIEEEMLNNIEEVRESYKDSL